jgi:putative effector of murein hydrolase LrgA (UPF0299 family)
MHVLYAVAILFVMQLLGDALVRLLGVPLPGPLAGLLLLFVALLVYGKTPKGLRDTSGQVLQHLMLLFIPAVAGIMMHFDRIASEWLPFMLACVVGAVLTLIVTAVTFRFMLRRSKVSEP